MNDKTGDHGKLFVNGRAYFPGKGLVLVVSFIVHRSSTCTNTRNGVRGITWEEESDEHVPVYPKSPCFLVPRILVR